MTTASSPGPLRVSVVMPTLNGARTIGQQLEALSRQSYTGPWEVIVVDNGSRDGTKDVVAFLAARLPRLRLVEAHERRGANYARNAGCRASGAEVLLFCDSDDAVCPNWIAEMLTALNRYDAVGGSIERKLLNNEVALAARPPRPVEALWDTFRFLPYPLSANCGIHRESVASGRRLR